MNLGKSIKVALAKAGKNQHELAEQMGLSFRFVNRMANSKTAKMATAEKFATVFGMKVSEFIAIGEE
ncbi:MAG: helix-turn-helix domain-containing protein [Pseudomonas sp.]